MDRQLGMIPNRMCASHRVHQSSRERVRCLWRGPQFNFHFCRAGNGSWSGLPGLLIDCLVISMGCFKETFLIGRRMNAPGLPEDWGACGQVYVLQQGMVC